MCDDWWQIPLAPSPYWTRVCRNDQRVVGSSRVGSPNFPRRERGKGFFKPRTTTRPWYYWYKTPYSWSDDPRVSEKEKKEVVVGPNVSSSLGEGQ